jgi:chromosome segregation ATPase
MTCDGTVRLMETLPVGLVMLAFTAGILLAGRDFPTARNESTPRARTAARRHRRTSKAELARDVELLRAELRAETSRIGGRIDRLEGRISELERRIGGRIDRLESRLGSRNDRLEGRISELERRIGGRIDRLESRVGGRIDASIHRLEGRLDRRLVR